MRGGGWNAIGDTPRALFIILTSSPMLTALIGTILVAIAFRIVRANANVTKDAKPIRHRQDVSTPEGLRPPKRAEFLLTILLGREDESILGDLEELFHKRVARFGERGAEIWYWSQVVHLCLPLVKMTGGKILKWGFIGWIIQVLRQVLPSSQWLEWLEKLFQRPRL